MDTSGAIWITGLAGAGKSTVAQAVSGRFRARSIQPVLLDGDRLRGVLPWAVGFTSAERRALGGFYGRLARELAEQGHLVICATISLFHEVQTWNRRHIPNYHEVWLRAPLEVLRERKRSPGLYGAGRGEPPRHVVGVDIAPEFPQRPDLVIDNFDVSPDITAERILASWDARRACRAKDYAGRTVRRRRSYGQEGTSRWSV